MHSRSTVPRDGLIAERSSVRPACDPVPGRAADSAEVTLRLAQDRDRIANGMNDVVVHRLFSAGLCLQTALELMGNHPGTAKVQEAVGELDLAIREFRNVLFDHYEPDRLPGGRLD
jgi:signal transduction histidine kinase